MRNDTYLYTSGLDSARRSNQVALWRASHQANIACKKAIEESVRQGFDGMHLNSDCVKEVLEEFGFKRVNWVLANTVQGKSWDGRFRQDNKAWAQRTFIPEDAGHKVEFVVESHPAVLDGFISEVRQAYQQLHLFGLEHCEPNSWEDLDYPEAVEELLGRKNGVVYPAAQKTETPPKPFELPEANRDMRRVFAYLVKQRHIDRGIVTHFAKAKTLYEDAKYHNCVFVGTDEQGVPRHAHKRSCNSVGKAFRQNIEGSDPRYSFHHIGTDRKLFVFEAPIDLLSYITINPEDWQAHSYVACCGTSAIPVLSMLERMSAPKEVYLCLDNDQAGETGSLRMAEKIAEQFNIASDRLSPHHKDWNDDLCVGNQEQAQAAMSMGVQV